MRLTVFAKTVVLLVCLLVPILLLYSYANQANVDMVVEEKQQSSLNQFSYFSSQVDKNIEQLSLYALTLLRDPSILHYRYMNDATSQYEKTAFISTFSTNCRCTSPPASGKTTSRLCCRRRSLFYPQRRILRCLKKACLGIRSRVRGS